MKQVVSVSVALLFGLVAATARAELYRDFSYTFEAPVITQADTADWTFDDPANDETTFHTVTIPGLTTCGAPGEPALPVKSVRVLVPYGYEASRVELQPGEETVLPGSFCPLPGQRAGAPGEESARTDPNPGIYGAPEAFPARAVSEIRAQWKRGYRLAFVNLSPVRFFPPSGELRFCRTMRLRVYFAPSASAAPEGALLRDRPGDREEICEWVENPEAAATYDGHFGQALACFGETAMSARGSIEVEESLLPPGQYTYVILTSQALLDLTAGQHPNLTDLLAHKIQEGLTARIVTVEEIYSTWQFDGARPDGGTDNQTKIRNFIRDAYVNWQTDYVFLVGDCDGGKEGTLDNTVPIRLMRKGSSQIDYASDLYYSCLDGTFDYNGDGIYGGPFIGENGLDPDLCPEVYVGRAPADSAEELLNVVRKTLAYAASQNDPYLAKVLLAARPDHSANFIGMVDYWADGCGLSGYDTAGMRVDEDLTFDECYLNWTAAQMLGRWNASNYHMVVYAGHASEDDLMGITQNMVANLSNPNPFFLYTGVSCYAGCVDNMLSEPYYIATYVPPRYQDSDCILEQLVGAASGPFAGIGNTRWGWGGRPESGGSFITARQFFDAVIGQRALTLGKAMALAVENAAPLAPAHENDILYEVILLGDPETALQVFTSDLRVDRDLCKAGDAIAIRMEDQDFNADSEILDIATVVAKAPGGDEETVSLMETLPDSGIFTGSVVIVASPGLPGDGVVNAVDQDAISIGYLDPRKADGTTGLRERIVLCDFAPLHISQVQAVPDPLTGSIAVNWQTDEPALGEVWCALEGGSPVRLEEASLTETHALTIAGLAGSSLYTCRVGATDAAGNHRETEDFQVLLNFPPVADEVGVQFVVAGETLRLQLNASDGDTGGILSENLLSASSGGRVTFISEFDTGCLPGFLIDGTASPWTASRASDIGMVFQFSRPAAAAFLFITPYKSVSASIEAPKDIRISTSDAPNGPWTFARAAQLQNTAVRQAIPLHAATPTRYIRLEVLSGYNNRVGIAEVEAYSGTSEELVYAADSLPAGASVSENGTFEWATSPDQAGWSGDVEVRVTDAWETRTISIPVRVVVAGDSDGDGLNDSDECALHGSDPFREDSDDDGLSDGEEVALGSDCASADTDRDGLEDRDEIERYLTNLSDVDTDGDGLSDGEELLLRGSDPRLNDTDGDGIFDGVEARLNLNPLSRDTDSDGMPDHIEDGAFQTIEAGTAFSALISRERALMTCGSDSCGALGNGPLNSIVEFQPILTNILFCKAGATLGMAVGANGDVWTWGNGAQTPSILFNDKQIHGLARGYSHSLAVRANGQVQGWGNNGYGELGSPFSSAIAGPTPIDGLSNVVHVVAGQYFSLALCADGTLLGWGVNAYGVTGNAEIKNTCFPTPIAGLRDVIALECGKQFAVAAKADGTVWGWGHNLRNQVSPSGATALYAPVQISGPASVTDVAAGNEFALALGSDGRVWAWGANESGQIGVNSTVTPIKNPSVVPVPGVVKAIFAGGSHAFAVCADGRVYGWGRNADGELGDGSKVNKRVPTLLTAVCMDATDPREADSDGDGIEDGDEDRDQDGLSDADELRWGCDPTARDSDDDGVTDGQEVVAGKNPMAADPWYRVKLLGAGVKPAAVNGLGHVAGSMDTANGARAFLYKDDLLVQLPAFAGASCSMAYDLNDSDIVVGWCNRSGNYYDRACAWENGVIRDLGAMISYNGLKASDAVSINNAGHIAVQTWGEVKKLTAYGYKTTSYAYPYLIKDGRAINLGALNGLQTFPACINEAGTVVGRNATQGFVYENGAMLPVEEFSWVERINDRGDLLGRAVGAYIGVLPAESEPVDDPANLAGLGGGWTEAQGMNNHMRIVGSSKDRTGKCRAFLYSTETGMLDLNACIHPDDRALLGAGGLLAGAADINDQGQIVGTASAPNAPAQGALLTPSAP
jgi:probable HAF family extracellular repeat protein